MATVAADLHGGDVVDGRERFAVVLEALDGESAINRGGADRGAELLY